jgi:hypothetical protein
MATKAAIRARLKSAKDASEKLQEDVRWLVRERAWKTLGYANLREMWEKENAFKAPAIVLVSATIAMAEEGLDSRRGYQTRSQPPNGHRYVDIAQAIGLSTSKGRSEATPTSTDVWNILRQFRAGISIPDITTSHHRSRPRPIRQGKLPSELVSVGWSVYKYQAEAIKEVARKAGVPDSVVVRSALDAYLQGKLGAG